MTYGHQQYLLIVSPSLSAFQYLYSVGDIISIDLSKGILVNETTGDEKTFEPFKEFMLNILEDGGLVNHYLNDKDLAIEILNKCSISPDTRPEAITPNDFLKLYRKSCLEKH